MIFLPTPSHALIATFSMCFIYILRLIVTIISLFPISHINFYFKSYCHYLFSTGWTCRNEYVIKSREYLRSPCTLEWNITPRIRASSPRRSHDTNFSFKSSSTSSKGDSQCQQTFPWNLLLWHFSVSGLDQCGHEYY